jgi:hypothetical protein
VVGLILERGLRIDNLHATEQRALIGYTLTVKGLGVALATIVVIGAGAHPEWERARPARPPRTDP